MEQDKKKREDAVRFSGTSKAYERLIAGEADMIFAFAPSEAQKKLVAEKGLTLTLTPIAREALVFLVNTASGRQNLSTEQIRKIYSGEIHNWKDGGEDKEFTLFQHSGSSDTQTIMLQDVMQGTPMRKPLEEGIVLDMELFIRKVADDRNVLGYSLHNSFRFYINKMNPPVYNVRPLDINGTSPDDIRYPLTVDVYIVTARPLSENAQKLRDWFLSIEGQREIERMGYSTVYPELKEPFEHEYYDGWGEYIRQRYNKPETTRQTPSIQFDKNYPRLDGATAFFPVYTTAAQAIYLEPEKLEQRSNLWNGALRKWGDALRFSRTPEAYERLIAGEADMIFTLAPSEAQQKLAAEKGLTLTLTPIAKEAFVFLVNEQNPVRDLSVDQIRSIYNDKINNWKEVGGQDEKILPFQRPENSGSQTIMLKEVMRDTPMREPLVKEIHRAMRGLIQAVVNYRNHGSALGYSFRFYATKMNPIPGIRLLSINGVAPSPENIRNQTYPLTVDVYIVTARPLSENAQKLRDWFLSGEGQQLIEDVGYIPITPPTTLKKYWIFIGLFILALASVFVFQIHARRGRNINLSRKSVD
jgi:ABC-type phosphate transport system substrate-binding protein